MFSKIDHFNPEISFLVKLAEAVLSLALEDLRDGWCVKEVKAWMDGAESVFPYRSACLLLDVDHAKIRSYVMRYLSSPKRYENFHKYYNLSLSKGRSDNLLPSGKE